MALAEQFPAEIAELEAPAQLLEWYGFNNEGQIAEIEAATKEEAWAIAIKRLGGKYVTNVWVERKT